VSRGYATLAERNKCKASYEASRLKVTELTDDISAISEENRVLKARLEALQQDISEPRQGHGYSCNCELCDLHWKHFA